MAFSKRHAAAAVSIFLLAGALTGAGLADDSENPDQEMERYLRKARVVRVHRVMSATTFPMALDLETRKRSLRVAFKYGHEMRRVPGDNAGDPERIVLDSYRHEVAAYKLDRALGLRMVPVAVLRTVNTDGAVIEWISDSLSKEEARGRTDRPADPDWLARQIAAMQVFDALIDNRSRDDSDQLVTPVGWRLRLIDHSQAFSTSKDLPKSYDAASTSLVRELLERLGTLDEEAIRSLLAEFLSEEQLDALIARRALLLE